MPISLCPQLQNRYALYKERITKEKKKKSLKYGESKGNHERILKKLFKEIGEDTNGRSFKITVSKFVLTRLRKKIDTFLCPQQKRILDPPMSVSTSSYLIPLASTQIITVCWVGNLLCCSTECLHSSIRTTTKKGCILEWIEQSGLQMLEEASGLSLTRRVPSKCIPEPLTIYINIKSNGNQIFSSWTAIQTFNWLHISHNLEEWKNENGFKRKRLKGLFCDYDSLLIDHTSTIEQPIIHNRTVSLRFEEMSTNNYVERSKKGMFVLYKVQLRRHPNLKTRKAIQEQTNLSEAETAKQPKRLASSLQDNTQARQISTFFTAQSGAPYPVFQPNGYGFNLISN
ncbi:hypothetical protein LXL04_015317 [Taraxacum kok-saghyz]